MRLARRNRSRVRSSLRRDHSRNSTITGSVGSSRRRQCGSVRSRGQHPGVPPVVLCPCRRQPVAEAVELFRVDRVDGEAAFHQALDHRPAWRLDRHADFARVALCERQQPVRHLQQPFTAVLEHRLPEHLPGSVEHARLMLPRSPVDTREPNQLQVQPPFCRIERARPDTCRSLYRRSTAQTPHWASIGGWTAGHKSFFGARSTGDPSVLPVACPTPRGIPRRHWKRYRDPR